MAGNPNAGTRMYYTRQSDGLTYCFSPVPLISDSKEIVKISKDGANQIVGTIHTVTFAGTLLPNKPALSGVDPNATCLELLDRKHDQLCTALDEDYGNLLIVDSSGYPVLSVYPKVESLDFAESQMVQRLDYTVAFTYEEGFSDDCRITEFNDSWEFAQNDDDTSNASRTISAVGIDDLASGSGAFEAAKTYVLQRANSLDRTKYAFLSSPYVNSSIDLDNLTEYNHTRSESSNVPEGSYSLTETWVLSSGNYKDDRTTDTSYEADEFGILVPTVAINGTIQGYGDTTAERLSNAQAAFANVVAPEIGFYSAAGISAKSRSDNRFAGTVSYSLSFDQETIVGLTNRSVSRQLQRNDDGSVTQTVTTSAQVPLTSSSGIEVAIEFCNANNYPIDNYIEPFFTASLSGNVESVSITHDEVNKSYSLTRAYRDQETALWREEYSIERQQSVENATTQISINGTVQGLGAESGTKSSVRFANASGAYFNIVAPLISTRIAAIIPTGTCVSSSPVSQTLGYNVYNGSISYSQTFDNRFLTDNPAIQSESVDVTINIPSEVIAEIPIPGKSTGPILQDQETLTGAEKSIRINYKMAPSGFDCGPISAQEQYNLQLAAIAESNILVNNTMVENERGEKPIATRVFKTADQYTFNRQSLEFSRTTTWKYTIG